MKVTRNIGAKGFYGLACASVSMSYISMLAMFFFSTSNPAISAFSFAMVVASGVFTVVFAGRYISAGRKTDSRKTME
jgi:hypothetical protein